MSIVAFFAQLDQTISGSALCAATGTVSFRPESTGVWQVLTHADAPRLTLCGRVDLAEAQRLADGNVYAWVERRCTEHARVAEGCLV